MAKLKITIRNNRVDQEGLSLIYVSIAHKQKTAYIPTDIKVRPEDFIGGQIVRGKGYRDKNAQLQVLLCKYKERLDMVENINALSVLQIKELIEDEKTSYTMLSEAMSIYRNNAVAESTKENVTKAWNAFMEFNKNRDVTLLSITPDLINKFNKYLLTHNSKKNAPYSPMTIRCYIGAIRTAVRNAIKNGMVSYRIDPFVDYKPAFLIPRENNISIDTFNIIRNYKPKTRKQEMAKDLFLLSFYLGGMNLVDMLNIDFRPNKVTYIRTKTEKYRHKVTISIFPQCRVLLDKWINPTNGHINVPYKGDYGYKAMIGYINDRFLKWNIKKEYGIDEYITFYSARKFFSQVGRNLGISDTIIDYILGHSPSSRGIISHYSSITSELAEEAMNMIFEFVENPEDLKAIFRRNVLKNIQG